MTVGELFDGDPERAAATDAGPTTSSSTGSCSPRRGRRASSGRRSSGASGCSGRSGWPTLVFSNHDQPRQASRFARSAGSDDADAIAKAAAVLLARPCAGRRSCTTARSWAWATSRSRRTRSSTRRRASPGRTSRGGTATSAGRRCRGPPDRAPGSRPAGRGSGSARTRPAAMSPRRPPTRARSWRRYRRLLEARRSVTALRRGSYESIDVRRGRRLRLAAGRG